MVNNYRESNRSFEKNSCAEGSEGYYQHAISSAGNPAQRDCIYQEAIQRFKTPCIYTCYMQAIHKQSGPIRHIRKIVEEASQNTCLDERFYACYMLIEGQRGNIREVRQIFRKAMQAQKLNEVVFGVYIKAEGMSHEGNLDLCQEAFSKARRYKMINELTYSSFIHAASNLGNRQLAYSIFQDACQSGYCNEEVLNSYLRQERDTQQQEKAKELYQTVLAQRRIRHLFQEITNNVGSLHYI